MLLVGSFYRFHGAANEPYYVNVVEPDEQISLDKEGHEVVRWQSCKKNYVPRRNTGKAGKSKKEMSTGTSAKGGIVRARSASCSLSVCSSGLKV